MIQRDYTRNPLVHRSFQPDTSLLESVTVSEKAAPPNNVNFSYILDNRLNTALTNQPAVSPQPSLEARREDHRHLVAYKGGFNPHSNIYPRGRANQRPEWGAEPETPKVNILA